jgi:small subunit ribosomal protein S13
MARIVGVDIPRNKKAPYSLSYIHGIGLTTAKLLCEQANVDLETRVQELTE